MNRKITLVLLALIIVLISSSCKSEDNLPENPDGNNIEAVVMSVGGQTYRAMITDDGFITMTVPYTVTLNGAKVRFVLNSSAAKVIPDPETITDWDTERIFQVTSHNGASNQYTYRVLKEEIMKDGDLELKTAEDLAKFVEQGTTVVRGNLFIGSNEFDATPLDDLSALSKLKEVEGNIVIRNSYTGQDLTGLDNLTKIGGLYIGSPYTFSTCPNLHMVSMKSLKEVRNNIIVRNYHTVFIEFNNLKSIGGSLICSSALLENFEFPELTTVQADFDLQAIDETGKASGVIENIDLPKLSIVQGRLGINNIATLKSLSFANLKSVESVALKTTPVEFEKLNLKELTTIRGDFEMKSNKTGEGFQRTGNTKLTSIDGFEKLTTINGAIIIEDFAALIELPKFSSLKKMGGISLYGLPQLDDEVLDLSNVDFETIDGSHPFIKIGIQVYIGKLLTKEDLSNVDISFKIVSGGSSPSTPTHPKLNFKKVNNFSYEALVKKAPYLFDSIEEVFGNLTMMYGYGGSIPNLKKVGGYLDLRCDEAEYDFNYSKLTEVGGQMVITGGHSMSDHPVVMDFSNLKSVCMAEDPSYTDESILPGALVFISPVSITGCDLTSLEKVGKPGLTINSRIFTMPNIKEINGTLILQSIYGVAKIEEFGKLEKLSGVKVNYCSDMNDFSYFGKFIKDNQITKDNWNVTYCEYNPTYEDMVAGRYTPSTKE